MLRCLFVLLLVCVPASAQEWTRFRGPNGSGAGKAPDVPSSWKESDFLWKTPLPGKGHSSPVLWGKKIFLTAGDRKSGDRVAICVDADTGKILWKQAEASRSYKMHQRNTNATASPAVDADHVYFHWATPDQHSVYAFTHDGKPAWKRDLGPYKGNHGIGVSPIVYEGLLIVADDQDDSGKLYAFDAKTGETKWTVPRKSGNATYATPLVYQDANQPPVIVFTNWQHGITGVDPKTGKVAWEVSVFEPKLQERSIVSPLVFGDLIIGTCGFTTAQKHFVAVRPDGNGKAKEIWRFEKAVSHMPTPVIVGKQIYIVTEKGVVTCLEGKDGSVAWSDRLASEFLSSPVAVDDRIFCCASDGNVTVLKAGSKLDVVGTGSLGEATQATPAVAHGRVYFRTEGHVMALGK